MAKPMVSLCSLTSSQLLTAFDEAVGRILKAATGGACVDGAVALQAELEVRGRMEALFSKYECETRAKHDRDLAAQVERRRQKDKLTRQRIALQTVGKENITHLQGVGNAGAGPSHVADAKLLADWERKVAEQERALMVRERRVAQLSRTNVEREQDLEVLEMRIKDHSHVQSKSQMQSMQRAMDQEFKDFKRKCVAEEEQVIASSKQAIAGHQQKVLLLEARISERERAVSSVEADIARRHKDVAVAESAIRSRERENKEKLLKAQQQIRALESTASERQERLQQADRQLHVQTQALENKLRTGREALAKQDGVVAKMQRELDNFEQVILGRDRSAKEAEHAFASRERQLEDRERQVTERDKQQHDSLQNIRCRLADQEMEQERAKKEVDKLQEQLASQEQDSIRRRRHLDDMEQTLARERSKLSTDQRRCDENSAEGELRRRREAEEGSRLCAEAAELGAQAQALERREAVYLQERADLAVLETKLGSNEQALADREARQREVGQQAAALQSGLANWERSLQDRERAASDRQAELVRARAQDAELDILERTLVSQEEALAQKEQQLGEREQRLLASEEQFTSHEATIKAQQAELEDKLVHEQASCGGTQSHLRIGRPWKTARKQVGR
mmetsp:Transcript_136789/g.266063  ORF Transcript_136789/g.266063 Transcript_136789/m.266063 type:complete len:629 (+) Transcript_136789:43-1929(+)